MRNLPTFDPKEILPIVQRGYGIKVENIIPHRRVFRLETNMGVRFFKPFHLSEARLQLIVKAKEHLYNQGFTELCPFSPTIYRKPYLKVKSQLYYMTPWIQGHPSNYDSPFELKRGVQVFARFHKAARNFDPPDDMLSYLGKWPEIYQERIAEFQECQKRANSVRYPKAVDTFFLDKCDYYIDEAEKAIAMLKESEYDHLCRLALSEKPFCHHDPAHHNVLITPENETVLIDFDYILQDLHLHDLASLVIRNGKASEWNLKRAEYLLKAYSEVREVSSTDLAVVRAFMTFPYDIWFWARSRYIDERPWPEEYYSKEWERKTRDEGERQQFLAGFLGVEL